MAREKNVSAEVGGNIGKCFLLGTGKRWILVLVLFPFSVLSAVALWRHGYWRIFEPHFRSYGAAQVLMDLSIALGLVLAWMWADARKEKRSFWPWALLTLAAGSFGPLLYLLFRRPERQENA